MTGNLDTTNTLLGVMAAVSVLEALLLIAMGIGGFMIYRRVMRLAADLEARQIEPVRAKLDAILVDVKAVTARVSDEAERVDQAIHSTMDLVDDAAARVKSSVRDRVRQAVGVVHGIRAVLMSIFEADHRHEPPAAAAGRAAS